MPLPLVPIASLAARYGLVAMVVWTFSRNVSKTRRDQRAEDALDDLPEGVTAGRNDDSTHGTARIKRTVRIGANGPGIEIDLTALGRLRITRVPRAKP